MARHSLSRRAAMVLLASLCLQFSMSTAVAQEGISGELARSESLYYSAQFQSALTLLLDLEKRIGNDPQSADDRLKVKLFMGLAYLALNQTPQAKASFMEVCRINGKYSLNRGEFPPKATTLFEEAKAECAENVANSCSEICGRPRSSVADLEGLNRCSCAPAASNDLVRTRFEEGQSLYRKGKFAGSVEAICGCAGARRQKRIGGRILEPEPAAAGVEPQHGFLGVAREF